MAIIGELSKVSGRVTEPGIEGLILFLEEVALVAGDDNELEEEIKLDIDVKKDSCVKLMTLHSSKGLEFDVVFMVGMVEGKLPHVLCSKTLNGVEDGVEEVRVVSAHCNTAATHCTSLLRTVRQSMSLSTTAFAPSRLTRSKRREFLQHCNTLQHTATHCNTLQHISTYKSLQPNPRVSARDTCSARSRSS